MALNLASAFDQSAAEARAKADTALRPIKRRNLSTTSTIASTSTHASNGNSIIHGSNLPPSPIHSPPPLFESCCEDVSEADDLRSIQFAILCQVYPRMNKSFPHYFYERLPGPQPVSIARKDLAVLNPSKNVYWVCEKSDGERGQWNDTDIPASIPPLLSSARQTAGGAASKFKSSRFVSDTSFHFTALFDELGATFIIDRKFLVRRVNHPVYAWSSEGDSLMDGELVRHDNVTFGPTATFMAFDLLLLNGARVMDENLSARLKTIGNLVVLPYRKRFPQFATFPWTPPTTIDSTSASSSTATLLPDLPLAIRAKKFTLVTSLYSNVFKYIHRVVNPDGDCEYYYDDGQSKNKNDGVIFTPEHDDYWCKNVPLLKWKWPELNTIDFLVQAPWFEEPSPDASDGKLMLYSSGKVRSPNGSKPIVATVHFCSTELDPGNRTWFLQQVADKQSAIVEMQYDPKTSRWKLKTFRTDKATPNFMPTVAGTLTTMIDRVTTDDLYQACGDESGMRRESTITSPLRTAAHSPNLIGGGGHSNSTNHSSQYSIFMHPSLPPLTSRTTEAFKLIYEAKEETLVKSSRLFGD